MPSQIINSLIKGAEILKCLSRGVDRVSDLSEQLNLGKSTTHRLLKSLEKTSMVRQDPINRRYYLGPLIVDLASKPIIGHQNLIVSASEDMRFLRDLTGETVVIHIRMGLERICLEELQSLESIKYTAGKGFVAPIYTGSAGKMLLSELKENELQLLLKYHPLNPVGPNTITDKSLLLRELEKVKKQGYATSFSERIPGAASVSVPIKNYVCPVALSILGPDNRFTYKKVMEILEVMKERAIRISEKLGGTYQRG